MNRKQRRAAKDSGKSAAPPSPRHGSQGTLEEAVRHHQAGRLDEARRLYQQILALDPYHSDALHLLGLICDQVGEHHAAIEKIAEAIAINAKIPAYHSNLGIALAALGRYDEAVDCYRRALILQPEFAEAFNNLGIALMELGRLDEAANSYRQAIALKPAYAQAHSNLGNVLHEQGRFDEAILADRHAITLQPDSADAYANLGNALFSSGLAGEAVESYQRAITLKPNSANAYRDLGVTLHALGRLDEAEAACRHAIRLRPDDAVAHANLAVTLLLTGRYAEGWSELDWRFRTKGQLIRPLPQPLWRGEDLAGRTLLVWGEQGIGDELVFFAFLPELLARGARLVVECDPRLVPLLRRSLPRIEVVARQTPPDPHCLAADIDFQIPAQSVAAHLRPKPPIAPLAPYLRPDAAVVAELRRRYGGDQGVKLVGLSWWSRAATARQRSFALSQWAPILRQPGIRWVSLQYGDRRDEIAAVNQELGIEIVHDASVDPVADIDRATAQIAAMDLIVTMDNSTVHCAAMLGAPAILLTPFSPNWLSGLDGESSPWSPGVRLVRQRTRGEWGPVIDQVAEQVGAMAGAIPASFSPQEVFAEALAHHQSGRLTDAEALYHRVLDKLPRHAESLHLLGAIFQQTGRAAQAIEFIGKAIALKPEEAIYHFNLGLAQRDHGQGDRARASWCRAVSLDPRFAEAHNNLGLAAKDQGRIDEAIAHYDRALAYHPDYAEALNNRGLALQELGRLDEAIASYRKALATQPGMAEIHNNLGTALQDQLAPDQAEACYRQAIALQPNYADAHNNLGLALKDLLRFEEAAASYRQVIAIDSNHAGAFNNLAVVLREMLRLDEAEAACRRAIALDPDYADAHSNLALTLLLTGRYSEGWPELDWRFRTRGQPMRPLPQPMWRGEDLAGRTLLVWGEQGIGDELVFFAFLPELLARGARLVVECDPRLVPLLRRSLPRIEVVARQTPPDPRCLAAAIDFQIPAQSVAAHLRPKPPIAPLAPYLRPDAAVVAELRRRYAGDHGVKLVGLSWWSRAATARQRRFALSQWAPILRQPGIRWVSLQYGDRRDEIAAVNQELGIEIIHDASVDPVNDIDRAAAQIAAMDLTVTMDNSTVHFAAMLGAPAILLVPLLPSWLTGMTDDTSPWSPNILLFRQRAYGDWAPVIGEVAMTVGRWERERRGAAQSAQEVFVEALGHHRDGRLATAKTLYRRVVDDAPGHADCPHSLEAICQQTGRSEPTVEMIGKAIAIQGGTALYHFNQGLALRDCGRLEDALACWRQAVALDPCFIEAINNLGLALKELGRLDEAVTSYRQAANLKPDSAETQNNLGTVLHGCGRLDEAEACYRMAIRLKPDYGSAYVNLGLAQQDAGRLDDALDSYRKAIDIEPLNIDGYAKLAVALRQLRRLDEAIAYSRKAIAIEPDNVEAHSCLSLSLLLCGHYPEGWREFEWRFLAMGEPRRPFPQPIWAGEDLAGRTLLVWGEQGIGDEIVFFALLPELIACGARLVVECDGRLLALIDRSLPGAELVARQTPPDPRCLAGDIDFQIAAGSVAARLRPTWPDVRPLSPYLWPDSATTAELRRRYRGDQGVPLVGIAWWSKNPAARNRCFTLAQWRPILQTPGVRFVSLQYGDHRAEIEAVSRELGVEIILDESVDPIVDMDRSAAQIAAMDLTVTIDNSTVHLAAMMGAPTVMLVPFLPSWFTGLTGEESPWSPGVRLVRQQAFGDWTPEIALAADLVGHLARQGVGSPKSAQQAFTSGFALHQKGRVDEAARLYRLALDVNPQHADSLHLLGVSHYQSGRFDLAIDNIGKAIAISGTIATYYANLGLALKALGRLDEAAACQRQAIALDRDFVEAHCNLALVLMAQGHFDEAITSFSAALALNPHHLTAHYNLGLALYERGRLDEAVASYLKAIAHNPCFVEAYNNLGLALKDQGRLDEAVTRYRQAIGLNPELADAHSNLGVALQQLGRLDEAIACYQRAGELNADIARTQSNRPCQSGMLKI